MRVVVVFKQNHPLLFRNDLANSIYFYSCFGLCGIDGLSLERMGSAARNQYNPSLPEECLYFRGYSISK